MAFEAFLACLFTLAWLGLSGWFWVEGWTRGQAGYRTAFWIATIPLALFVALMVAIEHSGVGVAVGVCGVLSAGPVAVGLRGAWALDSREVSRLAGKRRLRGVRSYLSSLQRRQMVAALEFKSRMKREGEFARVDLPTDCVASWAASLLKYKKHEWILVAFLAGRVCPLVWYNKGLDRTQVSLYLSPDSMRGFAKGIGAETVLVFHNHPNPDPHRYNCTRPSGQDIQSAGHLGSHLTQAGMSLVEYVCERGTPYRYYVAVGDRLLPVAPFAEAVRRANRKSWWTHVGLHLELWLGGS